MTGLQKSSVNDVVDFSDVEATMGPRPTPLYFDSSFQTNITLGIQDQMPVAMYADMDTSYRRMAFDQAKARLIAAVRDMKTNAPSWDAMPVTVKAASALAAELFLDCLPENRALPKVAADGEGDLMFVWDRGADSCIVIVEAKNLHLVNRPGTPAVEHVDTRPFYGAHLPVSILRHLPMK